MKVRYFGIKTSADTKLNPRKDPRLSMQIPTYANPWNGFDEWLPFDTCRIAPNDAKGLVEWVVKLRPNNDLCSVDNVAYNTFKRDIQMSHQMEVQEVEKLGDCMFESAGVALYGDRKHHAIIRDKVMEYMAAKEDDMFSFMQTCSCPFGTVCPCPPVTDKYRRDEFKQHVASRSKQGVWGGHLSILCISQLYRRTVHIYMPGQPNEYEPQRGRTIEYNGEDATSDVPIRFCYTGMTNLLGGGEARGSHYDIILPIAEVHRKSIISTKPGIYEDERIKELKEKLARSKPTLRRKESDEIKTDQDPTDARALGIGGGDDKR